jgi:hypothetical protein
VWQVIDDPKDIVGLMDAHAAAAYERGRREAVELIRWIEIPLENALRTARPVGDAPPNVDVHWYTGSDTAKHLLDWIRARAAEEGSDE